MNPICKILLGCKAPKIKHVLSIRKQVFMILKDSGGSSENHLVIHFGWTAAGGIPLHRRDMFLLWQPHSPGYSGPSEEANCSKDHLNQGENNTTPKWGKGQNRGTRPPMQWNPASFGANGTGKLDSYWTQSIKEKPQFLLLESNPEAGKTCPRWPKIIPGLFSHPFGSWGN